MAEWEWESLLQFLRNLNYVHAHLLGHFFFDIHLHQIAFHAFVTSRLDYRNSLFAGRFVFTFRLFHYVITTVFTTLIF